MDNNFIDCMLPVVIQSLYSKNEKMVKFGRDSISQLTCIIY